ncbi:MAG TPA: metalloregulator ArsR/SmtB family transcription factor [Chloroflexota bacterium]|nr:metalloregulator ArsR/SmtB family transcription factor [Chloroflexota bacterium]
MSGELEQPDRGDLDLPTVLAALADPSRLACVRALARHGETSCSDLIDRTGIECSKSTGSHHLRVLREAGVISMRVSGVHRYSTVRRADLDAAFPGLLDAVLAPPWDERSGGQARSAASG